MTLSAAWSNGTYTVTPNNGNAPKSTSVGLYANGQQDTATVSIYRDGNTSSTVKSENLFLVTTSSTTKADNKVDLMFHAKTGTGALLIATAKDVDKIFDAGYTVTTSQISGSNLHIGNGQDSGYSGSTNLGSLSKANIQANAYLFFTMTVHGTSKKYRITINP